MFQFLFRGAVAWLTLQFAGNFVASVTTSDRDDAYLARVAGWFNWLLSANGRAGAWAGRWARARWDAWRARRSG